MVQCPCEVTQDLTPSIYSSLCLLSSCFKTAARGKPSHQEAVWMKGENMYSFFSTFAESTVYTLCLYFTRQKFDTYAHLAAPLMAIVLGVTKSSDTTERLSLFLAHLAAREAGSEYLAGQVNISFSLQRIG